MPEANKHMIRKRILNLRNCLPGEEVSNKSSEIMRKIEAMEAFVKSRFIMCYVDFRNEVITRDFIKHCISKGKRVAVPLVVHETDTGKRLRASEIFDTEDELESGYYGILEPKKSCVRIVNPPHLDFIVVPGIAFDPDKNRLGYGGGFYDRFLRETDKECVKAAVAFDFQVLDRLPAEEHDMKMDIIITESKIIQ